MNALAIVSYIDGIASMIPSLTPSQKPVRIFFAVEYAVSAFSAALPISSISSTLNALTRTGKTEVESLSFS